jgi:CRP-like cAMP-binding protein
MMTGLLKAGDLFGIDSLTQGVHGENARTETAVVVRIVPVETLDRLLARQNGFAARLMEALIRRRSAAERLLARALLAGVPGRLAGALLDAADAGVVFGQTRLQLAEAAWTTRETATRILFQFAAAGLVNVDGRRIEIISPEALRQLAAGARQAPAA